MRPVRRSCWSALVALVALVGGAGAAHAATPGADCCFGPALAISDPVPAGDLRFGAVGRDGFPEVLIRRPDGALLSGSLADGRFAAPGPIAQWPYRDLQLGDVNGDGRDDLVGADGAGTVLVAYSRAAGFDPPVAWVRLPRSYAVLRVGDTDGDGAADLVGLDPRSRAIRVLQAPGTTAATIDTVHWPKGFTFQLADLDRDELVDAVGIDASGRIHIGFNHTAGFGVADAGWRLPAHVSLTVDDVTGDGRADLVYRRRGTDDVFVRRTYDKVTETKDAMLIETSFHRARRWGRWDRRLALTTSYLEGPRANLTARDPRTGRILAARSLARLGR